MIGCGLLRDPRCLSNLGLAWSCLDLTWDCCEIFSTSIPGNSGGLPGPTTAAISFPPLLPGISEGLLGPNRGLLWDLLHLSYLGLAGACQDLTGDCCDTLAASSTWISGACQDLTGIAARSSPPLPPGISGGLPGPNRGLLRDLLRCLDETDKIFQSPGTHSFSVNFIRRWTESRC
jgi:hypothetical protein